MSTRTNSFPDSRVANNLTRIVYYEEFVYPDAAINREKEIKAWRRSKKIRLIESMNPHWHDLAEKWTDIYKPPLGSNDAIEVRHPESRRFHQPREGSRVECNRISTATEPRTFTLTDKEVG